jgi:hypothetical protein
MELQMNLHEILDVPAEEKLEGFYVEFATDGIFLRRAHDDKLVVRHNGTSMTFYDPNEVDIYVIDESNGHSAMDKDVDLVMDIAWGEEGFSEAVKDSFDYALALMGSIGEDDDEE